MDTLEILAIITGVLAALCVIPGVILFVSGAVAMGAVAVAAAAQGQAQGMAVNVAGAVEELLKEFAKLVKTAWKVAFDSSKPPYERRAAMGIILILIGLAFFVATVGLLVAAIPDSGGGAGTSTSTT